MVCINRARASVKKGEGPGCTAILETSESLSEAHKGGFGANRDPERRGKNAKTALGGGRSVSASKRRAGGVITSQRSCFKRDEV